jgi:hypothetical protein
VIRVYLCFGVLDALMQDRVMAQARRSEIAGCCSLLLDRRAGKEPRGERDCQEGLVLNQADVCHPDMIPLIWREVKFPNNGD